MTDEEKAKEYCKNSKDFVKYTSETYKKRLKKAYLDGLAEGRKEDKELKAQIEKMKNFIFEEVDFCSYCPLSNECRNDEGTCPYAYATEEEQKNLLMDFIQKWEFGK